MDLNAILDPIVAFFSEGIGKIISDVLRTLYSVFYPANSEAAYPIEIPR